ncbi:ADP-ribosylglycohydrolase family protein [Muriicola sp. Z0-33]|uniref:ADP-ribosylglycohydrolase family protein n=1 Tax=Muriicola sp. Z0-33 TaxID=2816957 RepID=UPI002238CB1B|nr:ADP-ribosylglycohydrolase family protein [Muriicola sp. Z0-33]MCW5515124.1 ADP-ribosylglycohydrolase family protein [Muriicola sp. Z0-33]
MKNWTIAIGLLLTVISFSCKEQVAEVYIPEPIKLSYGQDTLQLSKEEYHDKVLGALVGSAIGDAMGASTEMWHRTDIQRQYGYISGLTPATRVQSPEGTWENNLNAGATTDDTRWKLLMAKYFIRHKTARNATVFAEFISSYYQSVAAQLGNKDILNQPDALDAKLEPVDWIKEWARVAIAYQKGTEEYLNAQHRFYGGEMSCAGMLYTPMIGLVNPNPEAAYTDAYNHTIFDLGYARDISALVSGLTNMALQTSDMDSIINTAIFIDPLRYQDSRLVGRISADIALAARKSVWLSREIEVADTVDLKAAMGIIKPKGYNGSNTEWIQQDFVYNQLEKDKKAIAFHSGEIWQILIASLEFGEGDFEKTIQFIVNYGRDNDTVAAVAGMILGAKDGFSGLPKNLSEEILRVNKEQLGIDLETLASSMVDELYK